MIPLKEFVSERRAANLLGQIRWRDGVYCPRYRTESTIRLLLSNRTQESVTVYTDDFRAYDPLDKDDAFDRKYVVHGEGEYVDKEVHVNTCENHASLARRWLSPHRGVSKDKLTPYVRAVQLRKRVRRKPGDEALKMILKTAL